MRVLVVGDTHSEVRSWATVVTRAIATTTPDVILSVGDFGYWPDHPEGRLFLEVVERSVATAGIDVLFIDGNHEQHDRLEAGPSPVAVGRRIYYIPRGARWCWEGVHFGALGGAVSPDRDDRIEGWDWFAEEAIDQSDLQRLGGARLDVLVTHDAPSWCPLEGMPFVSASVDRDTRRNRRFVDQAVDATCPALVLHGHWHEAHCSEGDASADRPAVLGLAAEDAPPNAFLALLEVAASGEGADRAVTWAVAPPVQVKRVTESEETP